VYAMGGNNGGNEQSARLMGLPVDRTKMQVYMLNGFCSALAGLVYSIYVGSGHGTHALGMELTVIAAVVIGGTALTGGDGYVLCTASKRVDVAPWVHADCMGELRPFHPQDFGERARTN